MYKRNSQNWIKHFDFIFLDVVVLFLSFLLSYYLYNNTLKFYNNDSYVYLVILLTLLNILVAVLFNTMHNVLHRDFYEELVQTVKQVFLLLALLMLVFFAMKWTAIFSRIIISGTFGFYFIFGCLCRLGWRKIINHYRKMEKRKMILICPEERVKDVLERKSSSDDAEYIGLVLSNRDAKGETVDGLPVVADLSSAAMYICREWVDEVFVFPSSIAELEHWSGAKPDEASIAGIIDLCRLMAVPVHIRVPLGGNALGKNFVEKVNGFSVITSSANVASPTQLFVKRVMDIAGGLVGSFAALIVLAVVGPLIKKESPGPLIYKQERIGQNGKHIKIYKIRSMYMDADERKKEFLAQNRVSDGMMFKLDFDPRVIGNEIFPDGTKKNGHW